MARTAKYIAQLPPTKGTTTQRKLVDEEADERGISRGQVIREALDTRFKLKDGEVVSVGARV